VITGASSGIGRASVSFMVRSGWLVFATVRKMHDGDQLRSDFGTSVTPILMDVTNRASVTTAAEQVNALLRDSGLNGLVNVAGVGRIRPVEYMTPEDLQEIFDINVFGQIAVTQAFLPLLRTARGRIVNIGSIGAHIAIPFGSLINASKSAFGILNDTLRLELHPFGIHVAVVEPGAIKTPAVDKTLGDVEAVIRSLPPKGAAEYGTMLRVFARGAYEREMNGSAPEVVAEAVQHALTANRPRTRYRVGKHATLLATLAVFLPDRLLDTIRFRITGMPTEFGSAAKKLAKPTIERAA
jgi:NAD(P)-dependent dehydrogenase (short-subunit alcohol dehydrogenase family)